MPEAVDRYIAYIAAPTEAVWRAIVDGDLTEQYFYGTRVASTWEPAAEVLYIDHAGNVAASGKVLAIEPGHRLELEFLPRWDAELRAAGPAIDVWIVEPAGPSTRLTLELHGVPAGGRIHQEFAVGHPVIVSGLKTLVETGTPLDLGWS